MMKRKHITRVLIALFAFSAIGCGSQTGNESNSPDGQFTLPSKADNYYSDRAEEYELTGEIPVEMTEEEFENKQQRNRIISERLTAVGLYLTAYVTAKIEGIDSDGSGEIEEDERIFENMDYGDFNAMVRNYSAEKEDIEGEPGEGLTVTFTIDVAGPKNFSEALLEAGAERTAEGVQFDLQMPDGATSNPDDVNRGEFRDFSPEKYDGSLETVTLTVNEHPSISDAYPHYDDFFEDGTYDITLFYGYDYNEPRSDLEDAEKAFKYLVRNDFDAPAPSFNDLTHESGAFTKTIDLPTPNQLDRDSVDVEVRIFHAKMFEEMRDKQKQRAISEITTRDVFFYNGHAGPYFGFYLNDAHTADVGYREFAELDFPEDKQQLFVAQGCQTYSQYADAIYENPAKSEENLDAITTVNYSYGRGTIGLLENLTKVRRGAHKPVSLKSIVQNLNEDWWNSKKDVFYGVMGMDGNSSLHPYANPDALGEQCQSASDCGSARGNACVEGESGSATCAPKALSKGSCPSGSQFGYVRQDSRLKEGVCFAR